MKKLVCTRDLPVLKSYRYVYGRDEWARDDDKTGITERIARLSGRTCIDDITVEEMDVKGASAFASASGLASVRNMACFLAANSSRSSMKFHTSQSQSRASTAGSM